MSSVPSQCVAGKPGEYGSLEKGESKNLVLDFGTVVFLRGFLLGNNNRKLKGDLKK